MFIPFNSKSEYHKYPFGAVKEGTEITFRIILPKNFGCNYSELCIRKDGEETSYVKMDFDRNEGSDEEWWICRFTPETSGLYFYFFRIKNSWGENKITRFENSEGRISDCGKDFYFTAYDRDFTTPDNIKGSVIYQIFPDRFCFSGEKKKNIPENAVLRDDWGEKPLWNPDENGNITKYDFFQGDLKGIEQKLDYLASLGVGYIYLNPIFAACSNHRYDTADYEKIDPILGNESDFKRLCKKAEEKGISIILDGVFSHTGSDSKYFNREKTYGEGGAYNDKNSEYFPWYKFTEYPDKYDCWWGVDILPEVDETNNGYIEYIGKVLEKWLKNGAKGWRLDVADELPDKFLDALRKKVKDTDKNALILGEVWEDASTKISYGERRRYLQGRQLDSVMNYPFADALINFAVTGKAEGFNNKINDICENYPKSVVDCLMNHIGTHDTCRILNRLGTLDSYESDHINRYSGDMTKEETERGIRLLKMISSMQFTLPGVPSVYYGDEVGTAGGVDPFNRGCFPWGKENEELLAHYRLLGKIRKEHSVFREGKFIPVSDILGCVCFMRKDEKETIAVVANRNEHPIDYYLPFAGFTSLTEEEINGNMVRVNSCSTAILVLDNK